MSKDLVLTNKNILITGAASGIGKAVALELARQGATMILLDRNVAGLEQVYDRIEAEGGAQAAIYPMDLSKANANDYDDLYENISKEFSQLDGLIHNAALLGCLMPVLQFDLRNWETIMQVNLHAPYMLTRVCLPLLEKAANASVLFTSDNVALKGKAYWGVYAMSKAASDNLMQILADELEINTSIRFNSINPGIVATALRNQAYPGENPSTISQPEDICAPYVYLMSNKSINISGQIIDAQSTQLGKIQA